MKKITTLTQSFSAYVKISLTIILLGILSGNVLAATYYSTAGGSQNLTTLTFWKTARNGTGTSPSNFTAGDIFVIQGSGNGGTTPHLVISTTAWSISGTNSKLQIENGASLQSNAAITLAAATTFQVDNGGTYNHNNTGTPSTTIYQGTESFGASSTVNILQWTGNTTVITTGVTLPYGNLTINNSTFSSAWNQSWSGSINLCAGNFTITTTGGGQFRFTGTGTTTVTVAGNYSQAADAVSFGNGNGANVTFNVGGDFSLSGAGNFLLTDGNNSIGNSNVTGNTNITTTGTNGIKLVNSGNGSTTGTFQTTDLNATGASSRMVDFGANGTSAFNIDGNFSKSGTGTFYTTSSSIVGSFVFNKAGTQTFSYAGATTQYTNYIVTSGSTLQMLTGLTLGTTTIPISSVTVNSGGVLDMGTQVITGGNNTDPKFTLSSGAKIITANATGVQGSITNIGAADLSLNSGANYEFQGAATGTFTTTTANTVNNLIINRSAGVTQSMAFTVNGNLDFQNGILTTSGNTLTVAAAGNIINFSSSKYVDGKLNRVFNAIGTKTFPVGKSGVYRAVNFNYTALTGTSTVSVEQFESALTGTLPAGTNLNNSRYWDISQSGGSSLSYKVTLDATGDNITGTVVMLKKESSVITSNAATAASPNYTNTTAYTGMTGTVSHTTGSTCTVSSNAGSDQVNAATCGLTQVTLAGNTPSFGTGQWSITSGAGGSFSGGSGNPSNSDIINPSFTGTAGTSYTLTWTITNGNCSSADNANITFNLIPAANSGDNNSTTICGNSSYAVTNASTTNQASFSWSSSSGNSAGFSSTTALNPTYTPNATDISNGSVTITLTAVNNPCTDATSNKTLTIVAEPLAGAGSDDAVCFGNDFITSATASGYASLSWGTSGTGTFTNGNTLNATYSPSSADSAAGSVVLTLTAAANSPCSDATDNLTLTINAAPTNTTVSSISGAADACSGQVSLMTANITGGSGFTYSWNVNTNPSVALFSSSAGGPFSAGPFQTSGNTVYAQFGSVVGSGYNVCAQVSNTCGTAVNKCVWIRGKVGTPGTINGSTVACAGNIKTYSCGASSGATLYTWTLGGSTGPVTGGQGSNTNVQVTFPVAFTSGQLCVTASLACGGSSASAPRCMLVSNIPVAPGAFTSAPSRVCPGQTNVLFSVTASNFASGYNWTVPVGASIVETPPYGTSIHVNFPNPYTGAPPVCTYATSTCASSPAKCKTVGSNKPGIPGSMNGPVNNVCNSTVQYSVPFDPVATSYTWSIPPGATNIIQNGPVIQFNIPGNFSNGQVSVVANTSLCTPGNSPPRAINISGAPPTPGPITLNPPVWCSGQTINCSVIGGSPLPNYVWTVSNGTIDGGQGTTNIDVNTANQGAIVVQVRASNSCGVSGNRVLHSSPGCREEENVFHIQGSVFRVYPNPAHDRLTVSIDAKEGSAFTLQLTDITGRVVLSENQSATEGLNTYQLGLNQLAKGVYLLDVKSGSENWKTKVVVE